MASHRSPNIALVLLGRIVGVLGVASLSACVGRTVDGDELPEEDSPTDTYAECSSLIVDPEIYVAVPDGCVPEGSQYDAVTICFYPPAGYSCESEPFEDDCIEREFDCLFDPTGTISCGPLTTASGGCCYVVWGECTVGD